MSDTAHNLKAWAEEQREYNRRKEWAIKMALIGSVVEIKWADGRTTHGKVLQCEDSRIKIAGMRGFQMLAGDVDWHQMNTISGITIINQGE